MESVGVGRQAAHFALVVDATAAATGEGHSLSHTHVLLQFTSAIHAPLVKVSVASLRDLPPPQLPRPSQSAAGVLLVRTVCCFHRPRTLRFPAHPSVGEFKSSAAMSGSSAPDVLASAAAVCRAHDTLAGLPHVAVVVSAFLDATPRWSLQRAAAAGYMALLKRLLQSGEEMPPDDVERAVERAAESGLLQVVRFLHEHFPERQGSWAIDVAASRGHLDVVAWLHANSTVDRATLFAMDEAAANGHLAVVQWLHENRTEGCTTRAMDCAARAGSLDIVQWLHANRSEGCTTQAMDWAAGGGHLEVVQWLHTNRREGCSSMAIDGAASNGHLRVALWLHVHKQLSCTSNAVRSAASRDHRDVLDWIARAGGDTCDANPVTLATAV